jgi:hypothetical protein
MTPGARHRKPRPSWRATSTPSQEQRRSPREPVNSAASIRITRYRVRRRRMPSPRYHISPALRVRGNVRFDNSKPMRRCPIKFSSYVIEQFFACDMRKCLGNNLKPVNGRAPEFANAAGASRSSSDTQSWRFMRSLRTNMRRLSSPFRSSETMFRSRKAVRWHVSAGLDIWSSRASTPKSIALEASNRTKRAASWRTSNPGIASIGRRVARSFSGRMVYG